ncbi:hypothetical protein FPV67DRAFT_1696409 [Lyophyllum atratum]|nr:hypothetical protein FPV67DRAFT_1696409 [Lyophyllum atratum]
MAPQRPALLTPDADPHEVLCRHFNVSKPMLPPGADLPATIEVPMLRPTQLPTHVLAVYSSTPSPSPDAPLLIPINAPLYASAFRVELCLPPTHPHPNPNTYTNTNTLTLPLLPLLVPHPPTLPLLLLFALPLEPALHIHTALAYRLLPPAVVEEFPNAAAMAGVLARQGSAQEGFGELVGRNEGMWKNVLALGVRERRVLELVGMVWGVTAEARRVRLRAANAGM